MPYDRSPPFESPLQRRRIHPHLLFPPRPLTRLALVAHDQAHAAAPRLDVELRARVAAAHRTDAVFDIGVDEHQLDGLLIVGGELDAYVAVLGGPSGRDAADEQRAKLAQAAH